MSKKVVFVQESKLLNGVLRFSSLSDELRHSGYVDSYGTLRNRDRIPEFENWLESHDFDLEFDSQEVLDRYEVLSYCAREPYTVNSPFLDNHELFPFQHVGLNTVWQQLQTENPRVLVQWDTGAGKTLLSCLTSQNLFDHGMIDQVLVFCKKIKQYDWEQEFRRMTYLDVAQVSGKLSRKQRHDLYKQTQNQVLVMNYEKVREGSLSRKPGIKKRVRDYGRTDLEQILEMIDGKRVLVVIDEAQKINTGTSLLSEGFERLLNRAGQETKSLALTATPYTTSPLNIRNIMSVIAPGIPGVSDLKRDAFKLVYGKKIERYTHGYSTELVVKEWDRTKLPMLGKKHENWTHIAMKSDPSIAAQFPESMPKRVVYELSDRDREIYEWAEKRAQEKYNPDNPHASMAHINTLRMICNTTEGLLRSDGAFAQEIVEHFGEDLSVETSSKYQLVQSSLETYFESNEKCVLFTFWTNGTLFPYLEQLKRDFGKDALILPIWGVGMSSETANDYIRQFNESRGPTVLITSDVLQEGANLYAPYLWNLEIPDTYAAYKQRKDRINRADSRSKGISHTWVYRPVALGTIEERMDSKVINRRNEAQAIRGVVDENIDMHDTIDLSPAGLLFG